MPLGPLTLDVTYGVAGRRFQASVAGQSPGSTIEISGDGTPGFGYVNGRLTFDRLPAQNPVTVVLRETLPGTGTRDSRIDIAVDGIALGAAGLPPALAASGISPLQQRLKRAASSAAAANPEDAGLSPFTLAQGTAEDGALTNVYNFATGNFLPAVRIAGSGTQVVFNNSYFFGSATVSPGPAGNLAAAATAGTFNATLDSAVWSVAFQTDTAAKVEIRVVAGTSYQFRILVDGLYVQSKTPIAFTGATATTITLTLDGNPHVIEFESGQSVSIVRLRTSPTATLSKPIRSPDAVTVFAATDSYGVGQGSEYHYIGAWPKVAGRLLGATDVRQVGLGGTGYLRPTVYPGESGAPKAADQIAYWAQVNPDLADANGNFPTVAKVYVAYGYNDYVSYTSAQIAVAATDAWVKMRAKCPNALMVILGPWAGVRGQLDTKVLADEAAIKAAFLAWGDGNSLFVPVNSDPTPFITGLGASGATTGSGNGDLLMAVDKIHPNFLGHAWIGRRVANAERAYLAAL